MSRACGKVEKVRWGSFMATRAEVLKMTAMKMNIDLGAVLGYVR